MFFFNISFNDPVAVILPPKLPANGPISIIWSEDLIIDSSCSTTIIVFPRSLNFFKTLISFSVSLEWSPIDGSSRTYIEPTKLLPIEVANWIRCDSPPEREFDFRFKVK